jgi:hypothetical protein
VTNPKDVAMFLRGKRFNFADEKELQDGIAQAFTQSGVRFRREVRLAESDIIDFVVEPGIGLEVKVAGSPSAVASQLLRYLGSPDISSLILVTARQRLGNLPSSFLEKPVYVVGLWRGML